MKLFSDNKIVSKPFLKWAGGKTQLIGCISSSLPSDFEKYNTYIEPFIGSGAVMFWVLNRYPSIKKIVINDINKDLATAYRVVKDSPFELIEELEGIQSKYYSLTNEEARKDFFLSKREIFNKRNSSSVISTALLIFLNRTCFNGLYRVNSRNLFNVPFGRYVNPKICDKDTIIADSKLLKRAIILNGDYSNIKEHIEGNTFVYFDPPYRPLSSTSSFNSYSFEAFDDSEQIRLRNFCSDLNERGVKWLLSNSDPKNIDAGDMFFDKLYRDFNIKRITAKRIINSNADKRGEINELLISNYE